LIKFGTDGWRAEIARDYTFDNLRKVALATADYVLSLADEKRRSKAPSKAKKERPVVARCVVGYDTRFLSREFAIEAAMVLAHKGVKVDLCDDIASTPQVSFNTKQKTAHLGVIITASHNPYQYNGFKLKAAFGGPATPEQIADVEANIAKYETKSTNLKLKTFAEYLSSKQISYFNAKEPYIRAIRKKIDVDAIQDAGYKIVFDIMHGANMNTVKYLLPHCEEIHKEFNPSFGELARPEPIDENLFTLKETVRDGKYDIGFAFDGDADRLGAVDHKGEFVDSHKIFMILLKYLVEHKGRKGKVVKTVSLTSMVDAYCEKKRLDLIETPVGFKYVAEAIMDNGNVIIGGEESGGLATCLHIPERDGLFNAMLLLEVMVTRGMSLRELCQELDDEFGMHRYMRRDKVVSPEKKKALLAACAKSPSKIGKEVVIRTNTKDGYKFYVENGWVLIRPSGTEPLIRFYAEADSMGRVSELLDDAEKLAK
jgi:phosphomannomutase